MKDHINQIVNQLLHYNSSEPLFFTKIAFWIFFLFVILIYSILYKRNSMRNIYLLIVSWYIYYMMSGIFLILLIMSCFINYCFGLIINRYKYKKLSISIGILVNISILIYYKYTYLIIDTLNNFSTSKYIVHDWIGQFLNSISNVNINTNNIILPIGISFYTFQSISYLVDVKSNKVESVKNLFDFAFFLSFFPQLVAGPIIRAESFIPQLYQKYKLREQEFSHASFMVLKGLFKKLVIADFLASSLVDRVFDAPWAYSGIENIMAIYGYTLQIYCDFSGYTDIAIGLALILGFKIPINFNSPYQANSLTDFWKRWHISLSKWLKDYIYIPMGGNRKGKLNTYLNLITTMLIGGLWHGANWKFVIWGGIHGTILAIEKLIFTSSIKINFNSLSINFLRKLITFNIVCFTWIFFRANDMESIRRIFYQIINNFVPNLVKSEFISYIPYLFVLTIGFIMISIPIDIKEKIRGYFINLNWAVKIIISVIIVFIIQQISSSASQPFIYFQF